MADTLPFPIVSNKPEPEEILYQPKRKGVRDKPRAPSFEL
jgi:hypothetical protein